MRIKNFVLSLFCIGVVAVLGYAGYVFFNDMEGPKVVLSPNDDKVASKTPLTLTMEDASGIRSVQVRVRKGEAVTDVFSEHFSAYLPENTATFTLEKSALRQGEFTLEITVTDASLAIFGIGNSTTLTLPMFFDTTPPKVSIVSLPPYVRRGGTGVVQYSSNEPLGKHGVKVGEQFFPGYAQKGTTYVCYFAFPHTMTVDTFAPTFMAADIAGNTITDVLTVHPRPRVFKEDAIKITDSFLEQVSARLFNLAPDAATPLERFLIINKDIRFANAQFLRHLAKETSPTKLWEGNFARLPRAASRAGYGDHRTYVYNGEVVDNQSHLGFDLASVKHAPVPAANHGRVIFTGDLGIYGNLVVIDHGMGLMSLYSHLSSIGVSVGDTVKKGDTVGKTGVTGMAFGDHLHFGILVGGVEVTPLEWLDSKWIRDNITGRITEN